MCVNLRNGVETDDEPDGLGSWSVAPGGIGRHLWPFVLHMGTRYEGYLTHPRRRKILHENPAASAVQMNHVSRV